MIAESRKRDFINEIMIVIRGCGDDERAGLVAWLRSVCLKDFEERKMMISLSWLSRENGLRGDMRAVWFGGLYGEGV